MSSGCEVMNQYGYLLKTLRKEKEFLNQNYQKEFYPKIIYQKLNVVKMISLFKLY